ncbi:hypothetical protein AAHA92_12734 [Salvia divinorum]|uniref:Retrotransposon gag domain-containing protein n=1 Tax=Salvia divinorum TaxID=28513 RepID=A0ABD1HNV3_SALDI
MHRSQRFGCWNNPINWRDTESNWRIREVATPVTMRSGLSTACPSTVSSGSKEDSDLPPQVKVEFDLFSGLKEENMANMEDDPEIGSLNAHLSGEPTQAIVMTPRQAGIERRPAGSTEEVYRLRALPFALKGEADTWFMRLPPNSIRSWAEFRLVFLDYFFPAKRTNALKKDIQGATQEGDETLSQYWGRFKGLLDTCPNNKMTKAEIYNNFYEGLAPESKDLVNSSSGGDFSKLRLSEARRVVGRLIDAKKAYDNPRVQVLRRAPIHAATDQAEHLIEARMDRMEKAILNALEKSKQTEPVEKVKAPAGPEERYQCYKPPMEMDYQQQANAMGNWNPGGHWNQNDNWVPK